MKPPVSSHGHGTRAHQLTVPTNQASFVSRRNGSFPMPKHTGLEQMSSNGLDENIATFQNDLQSQRERPVRYWIQQADSLKRQADKSQREGDIESQYLCLAQCKQILAEFLPNEHPGFQELSLESQNRIRKNAETILNLLSNTNATLINKRSDHARQNSSQSAHNPEVQNLHAGLPKPSSPAKTPSPRGVPARSSLRAPEHSTDSDQRSSRSSTPKRVSFAGVDQINYSPSPARSGFHLPFNMSQVPDAPIGRNRPPKSRTESRQNSDMAVQHTSSSQPPSSWWSARKQWDKSHKAQFSHSSQPSLTLSATAEGPLQLAPAEPVSIQLKQSKTKKRNGWQLPDWLSRANSSTSQQTETAVPPSSTNARQIQTQNPDIQPNVSLTTSQTQSFSQTQAPSSSSRAPQLSPLRLPNTSLFVDVHDPPVARDSNKSASSAVHAPNRLTGPSEISLIANAGKHDRQDHRPPKSSSRRGSMSVAKPELANRKNEINVELYQVISKQMTPHQQEQGFVPISETPKPPKEVRDQDQDTKSLVVASPTPPTSVSETSSPTKSLGSRPSRWNLFSRSRENSIPRVSLPGAEEHDVLTSAPIENGFAKQSASASVAESGKPLRRLHIPASLVPRFLECVKANTLANRETCGLLLGKEQNDRLYVTDLVLPPQTGDSDSCTAISEEETTALQISENLLTLGWIHTHPSQSCFLSSLDVHTQAGYQALLPEAVAVVCAPKHRPRLGVFRLTDPPGLRYVLNCKQTAAFHAHVTTGKNKDLPLYTDAISSHVRLDNAKTSPTIRVRDLR
ncbi:ubiquitinyl hydrolase 1 [Malassezia psittaci]|uniref:Ubiquitinyl hydrolase 1 n=1 Tax=Malassezia psittaci TaxID=1821823 RepID=A0AAF0JCM6_9BASI|nr:ubiquitinyl hydrolase 1 [Malassezia psittaci]